jgi:RHS repeat-associated protein
VKELGNQQDYGMRIYDPRIAKFLSVDPLTKEYPWYTPYQFAGNNPVKFIDLDGLEEAIPK